MMGFRLSRGGLPLACTAVSCRARDWRWRKGQARFVATATLLRALSNLLGPA